MSNKYFTQERDLDDTGETRRIRYLVVSESKFFVTVVNISENDPIEAIPFRAKKHVSMGGALYIRVGFGGHGYAEHEVN